ncbi:Uncharacterized protein TCM_025973 isoform 2, partial [Theobroma cacao]
KTPLHKTLRTKSLKLRVSGASCGGVLDLVSETLKKIIIINKRGENAMANSNPRTNLRCHHCAGPLSKEMETSEWTVAPLVRDSFSMIGSAVGGTTSAFYGFNHVMPLVRRWVKGPMWVHFLIGVVLFQPLLNLHLRLTVLHSHLLHCLHLHRKIRCISLGLLILCNYIYSFLFS